MQDCQAQVARPGTQVEDPFARFQRCPSRGHSAPMLILPEGHQAVHQIVAAGDAREEGRDSYGMGVGGGGHGVIISSGCADFQVGAPEDAASNASRRTEGYVDPLCPHSLGVRERSVYQTLRHHSTWPLLVPLAEYPRFARVTGAR